MIGGDRDLCDWRHDDGQHGTLGTGEGSSKSDCGFLKSFLKEKGFDSRIAMSVDSMREMD